ncbi:MAG: non-ribosomal peptide synthetase [Acidobacteriaceae bacterium]
MSTESMTGAAVLEEDGQRLRSIAHHFGAQAARTPDAIALTFREEHLTYRQVDQRSNQLARYLQGLGVGRETLVGVLMDRSPEMLLALLAVLKAGGAYVPLDPGYPRERTAFLIEDSHVSFILTTERHCAALPAVDAHIVSIDGKSSTIASQSAGPVVCPASEEDRMYVIYTSGSTGKPKGVMVEHRNVLSFFAAMDQVLGARPGVWLAITSISFDISVLELFWTLTRGFHVVLHGDEGTHTMAEEIVRHGVTHFQSTPSLARMIAANPGSLSALAGVEHLLLGGEALPVSLVKTLRRVVKGEIYNIYGPTETTVWSTVYRIPRSVELASQVPIGRPLANTQAYILGPDLAPVPDGEAGELFLGGEGVVRGYWARPELTAERFLADPFVGAGRMYRTGDVARFLPDGNIEYLGRTDFQVKMRGFRIELGEIEATLEQHSAVQQAVVVAREDRPDGRPGDTRLVGHVVLYPGSTMTAAGLRTVLELKLPEYMVPAQIVLLDRLPLTANGKIDRKALPAVPMQNVATDASEGEQSWMEQTIAQAWADVLGVDHIGLHQNFFDLGATSLMVPEVQIELQQKLGREVPLIDLFQFHTVSSLAGRLSGTLPAPRTSDRAQRRLAARNNPVSL